SRSPHRCRSTAPPTRRRRASDPPAPAAPAAPAGGPSRRWTPPPPPPVRSRRSRGRPVPARAPRRAPPGGRAPPRGRTAGSRPRFASSLLLLLERRRVRRGPPPRRPDGPHLTLRVGRVPRSHGRGSAQNASYFALVQLPQTQGKLQSATFSLLSGTYLLQGSARTGPSVFHTILN